MSEHISKKELFRYITLISKKDKDYNSNIDFINEIEAHTAECPDCFNKVEMARLLTVGMLSDKDVLTSYKKTDSNNKQLNNSVVILNIDLIRNTISGRYNALATVTNESTEFLLVPNLSPTVSTRGDDIAEEFAANDLVASNIELKYDNKKIIVRCEDISEKSEVLLYIYSAEDVDLKLYCDNKELFLLRKNYDSTVNEYIWVYKVSEGRITLEL